MVAVYIGMSEIMAAALRRGRDRYNSRFAYARAENDTLDAEIFADILRKTVAPIIDAVHAVSRLSGTPVASGVTSDTGVTGFSSASAVSHVSQASQTSQTSSTGNLANVDQAVIDRVLESLFDLSLVLLTRGFLGPVSRIPGFSARWQMILGSCPAMLASDPSRFAAAIANALCRFDKGCEALGDSWAETMISAASLCPSVDALLEAGRVIAWRLGILDQRQPALDAMLRLPEAVVSIVLALAPETPVALPTFVERLKDDPWLLPEIAALPDFEKRSPKLQLVRTIGGFRGFGGVFVSPPLVYSLDGVFVAADREMAWELTADCFGHLWRRLGIPPVEGVEKSPANVDFGKGKQITWEGCTGVFPELAEASSIATVGKTLAVTLSHSYNVYLLAPSVRGV
ncbi:MAG: hypothetical protein WA705_10185 [Candidatus Ozemobacteraceae bacterium]